MSASSSSEPPTAVHGLGLDTGGPPWIQRQRYGGSVSVQTYLLNSGALPGPPPPTAVGARVRLPALTAKGPRRKSGMARLSLSEPSLFPHNDGVLGLSSVRGPSLLHKRSPFSSSSSSFIKPAVLTPNPPPPLPQDPSHPLGSSRPLYLHFSQSIQPSLKPRAKRRHSHTLSSELKTLASQVSPLPEPLSVVGKTCLPMCSPRPAPATVGTSRPHIHVFLPSETEGEDSESVDEGFMDELDHKMSSLKLQQGAPQTVALHCNKKNWSHSCLGSD